MVLVKIKKLVARQLGIDVLSIDDNAKIIDDLAADSLDVVELIMAIEDAFGIEIENEEYEGKQIIKEIVAMVESKLQ